MNEPPVSSSDSDMSEEDYVTTKENNSDKAYLYKDYYADDGTQSDLMQNNDENKEMTDNSEEKFGGRASSGGEVIGNYDEEDPGLKENENADKSDDDDNGFVKPVSRRCQDEDHVDDEMTSVCVRQVDESALLTKKNEKEENRMTGGEENVDIPIDRGWAWMVVVGAFCMHIVVIGGCKSFGVLYVVFQDKYQTNDSALSTVMSLPLCLNFTLGVFANALSAKVTCRLVVFIGGILGCFGFFLTAFMEEFVGVIFSFGIVCGVAFSLCYGPCVVMVGQHFRKYRSLATGIAVAGSGVGTFIIPNLMRVLVREYGLRGCLIIFSGFVLNMCAIALLFRPWSNYKPMGRSRRSEKKSLQFHVVADENGGGDEKEVIKMVDKLKSNNKNGNLSNLDEANGDGDGETQTLMRNEDDNNSFVDEGFKRMTKCKVGKKDDLEEDGSRKTPLQCSNDESVPDGKLVGKGCSQNLVKNRKAAGGGNDAGDEEKDNAKYDENREILMSSNSNVVGEKILIEEAELVKLKKQRLLDFSLLLHPVFLMYAVATALSTPGYGHVFVMLPDYAETSGHDRDTAALITSIIGISDLAGRLFFGWFSDLDLIPKRWGFIGCMALSAFLNLILPFLSSFPGLVSYAVAFGFFSGSFITLIPVLLAEDLGTERLGTSFGLTNFFMAIALLSGPPICGSLKDLTGTWDAAFYFLGLVTLVGAVLPCFQPCGQRWVDNRERRNRNSPAM